jgi:alkylated DNA repair dioxygenase AlkB
MGSQLGLFHAEQGLPEGFTYRPELISPKEEHALLAHMDELPFRNFQFHGFRGKRRVVSFGWHYDFNDQALRKAEDIPPFLQSLRVNAAEFAGMAPDQLQHVLVTEYQAGAAIGWHRDKGEFGEVIGISLLSPCRFRLRLKQGTSWTRASLTIEPRSAYLLRGPARTEWEHSIPGVETLRYSITFRNLRE